MAKTSKKLNLSFAVLEFHGSVVVSTVKEDIVFDQDHITQLRKICAEYFQGQPFVYITNRKYNYNVNPVVYINLIQTNTLKGIGVVSNNPERLKTANFEKNFSPVPYELFDNKNEAIAWANSILAELN